MFLIEKNTLSPNSNYHDVINDMNLLISIIFSIYITILFIISYFDNKKIFFLDIN